MKKLFLFIVAIFAVSTLWAQHFQVGDLYYNIISSSEPYTAELTGVSNYVGFTMVTIPSTVTYNGITYSVTSIGENAFYNCSSLTSVTLPNSVTSIGSSAFYNCSSLASITIPNSVTNIGNRAFYGTGIYSNESNWENGVLYIGNFLIKAKESISGAYEVNENTQLIAHSAFSNCSALTSITIPNSVTSIGTSAFNGCSALSSITIPNGVTDIEYGTFYDCSSLTSVIIPNSVTSIGNAAFYNCSSLTYITIPNSVTSIGEGTFYGCSSLTSITIPNSITSIGNRTFAGCSSLTSITIPNSVTSIGNAAFNGCSSLSSITIPNGVTSIGTSAFYNCKSLTSITIPNSVTSIRDRTFYDCYSLSAVTIPNSVTSIGEEAFRSCSSLTSVTIPNSVTHIGGHAFNGTPWYNNLSDGLVYIGKVLYGYKGTMPANTKITVKEGTTCISGNAFYHCSGLTSIIIPNSVTSINDYTFSGCSSLISITIPENLTSIGYRAFAGCSSLTSITIPISITNFGKEVFEECSSLHTVCWNAKYCSSFASNYDYDKPFYHIASQITSFTFGDSVEYIPSHLCCRMSSLTSIAIPNSVTSIGGYAFAYCSSLTSIAIPCNVTSVDETIFYGCTSLASVVWNAKTSIDYNKFSDTDFYYREISPFHFSKSTLKSITFGDSVKYIPEYICAYLDSLKYVTIGNSVTSIGGYAFSGCSSLVRTNYTGSIGDWCNIKFGNSDANPICYSDNFYINDVEIKDLIIPNSVDSIHNYAFYGCDALTSVTIPNSVTTIGHFAFDGCDSLSYVSIGSGVTSIGGCAFYDCPLTSIIIPNSVTSIGNSAFYSCDSLKMVAIGKSVTSIGDRAFRDCPIDTVYSRNPTSPSIETGSYAPFNSKPICIVPCGCSSSYEKSDWKNYMSKFITGNVYFLNTIVSNPLAGRVEILQDPQCDYGATFQAIPNVGFEFVQWSDGVTDALRTLDLTQDTTLIAEFRQLFDGKCGDNLYWKHYDDKIIIHGEGTMYDYAADSVPWYQFRDIVKTVEVFDGATSIGNNAFTLCKNLNTLTLSGTIENIGENAFGGCRMLFDIYCYVLFPPIASETSFVNYNAYLYILCDYQRYYAVDMVFGNFRNMQCIGTQSTPTDGMVITPSFNDVTITWPTLSNAGSYTLAINKDGEVFCTLTFNAAGQLTGITFAPSRNGQRHAPAATQATNGFTFTVTGLKEGTDYSYNLVIKDNSGKTLQTYSGEFRTQSTNDRTVTVEYDATQGQVTGAGVYQIGDTVTLTAIPNKGYLFTQWSNGVTANPYSFVVEEDITLEAQFTSTTALENTHSQSPTTNCQKIIRNNQLLILRDDKTYNIVGQIVE